MHHFGLHADGQVIDSINYLYCDTKQKVLHVTSKIANNLSIGLLYKYRVV